MILKTLRKNRKILRRFRRLRQFQFRRGRLSGPAEQAVKLAFKQAQVLKVFLMLPAGHFQHGPGLKECGLVLAAGLILQAYQFKVFGAAL